MGFEARLGCVEKLLEADEAAQLARGPWNDYPDNPIGYCRHILGIEPTPDQTAILNGLLLPPYRVLVGSGHNVGKTHAAACATNWWYDSFDPGVVITTAPTERDVIDLLWTEIRLQRQRAGLPNSFVGLRAPEMRTSDEHYAKGYTARLGESFQGRHRPRMLFVFDEADGIAPAYWTTTKTMFKSEMGHGWIAIGNPVSTVSAAALEELAVDSSGNPAWRQFHISALEHPNIAAELAGQVAPYPHAVSLAQVEQWIADWFEAVPEPETTDIFWRGKWYRPGPVADARVLGRRPAAGTYGVWSSLLFDSACRLQQWCEPSKVPEIGCDVARFGDDWTVICVRWGPLALFLEAWNGWSTDRIAGRLKYWARYAAEFHTRHVAASAEPTNPKKIRVKIDDDGVGGGVIDLADGYAFIGVSAASKPLDPESYPNKRSELWFHTALRAKRGGIDLSRLPKDVLARLRQQACAPQWKMDGQGRRVVEPKEETKLKIGRSPDDMDALNLAFYDGGGFLAPTTTIANRVPTLGERLRDSMQTPRRPLFGRRS